MPHAGHLGGNRVPASTTGPVHDHGRDGSDRRGRHPALAVALGSVPELQDLKVGDVMATDRSGEGFVVEAIDRARSLVLSISSAEAVTSSALVLEPTIDGRTRLLLRLRLRAGRTPRGLGYRVMMEVGHVIMTRKTLSGIKARVESLATREAHALRAT
jgi:hypothetical protein